MSVTKQGLAQVQSDFEAMSKKVVAHREDSKRLDKRYHELMTALNCPHTNIVLKGGCILMEYQCKECGYTWMD